MYVEELILGAAVTIFSLGLLVLSLVSYQRFLNKKLLLISLVFIVLFIKGVILSLSAFFSDFTLFDPLLFGSYVGLFDVVLLVILFVATLKR